MLVPALIYLAWNAGTPDARDWGKAAISTDTAFALSVVGSARAALGDADGGCSCCRWRSSTT